MAWPADDQIFVKDMKRSKLIRNDSREGKSLLNPKKNPQNLKCSAEDLTLQINPRLRFNKFILVRKCLEDLYPAGFKIYNLCSEHKSFQRAKDVDGKIKIYFTGGTQE